MLAHELHRLVLDGELDPTRVAIGAAARRAAPLRSGGDIAEIVDWVLARVEGYGPLQRFLLDPAVSDVLVNGSGEVWLERDGRLVRTRVLLGEHEVLAAIERMVAPLGRRIDPSSPVVDARLPTGERVHAIVPPVSVDGPILAIRRFRARAVELAELAAPPVAALLRRAVDDRRNIVVSGATGAGKTTLLNALAARLPADERVVTVEDAAELRLPGSHVVRLETRPANADGLGEITTRDLVRHALRLRPDRLIVGEVRGAEAIDLLQAMNTGHDGTLSTVHANGPDDALRRLETLVVLGEHGLPLLAVREHLAAAIDLVVHVVRGTDGRRRVAAVAEVETRVPAWRRSGPTTLLADHAHVVAEPQRTSRGTRA